MQAASPAHAQELRTEVLPLLFQEALAVIAKIQAHREIVGDSSQFRNEFKRLLSAGAQQAQATYPADDVRKASFAVVAFLDESVQNSGLPAFSDWARRPLQEELFGTNKAGELFFSYLDALLTRDNSEATADVLEVYCLCLLLGFRGRYAKGGSGEINGLIRNAIEKIRRNRGGKPPLAPDWTPPADAGTVRSDPWLMRLTIATAVLAVLLVVLFAGYKVLLNQPVQAIQSGMDSAARGGK